MLAEAWQASFRCLTFAQDKIKCTHRNGITLSSQIVNAAHDICTLCRRRASGSGILRVNRFSMSLRSRSGSGWRQSSSASRHRCRSCARRAARTTWAARQPSPSQSCRWKILSAVSFAQVVELHRAQQQQRGGATGPAPLQCPYGQHCRQAQCNVAGDWLPPPFACPVIGDCTDAVTSAILLPSRMHLYKWLFLRGLLHCQQLLQMAWIAWVPSQCQLCTSLLHTYASCPASRACRDGAGHLHHDWKHELWYASEYMQRHATTYWPPSLGVRAFAFADHWRGWWGWHWNDFLVGRQGWGASRWCHAAASLGPAGVHSQGFYSKQLCGRKWGCFGRHILTVWL